VWKKKKHDQLEVETLVRPESKKKMGDAPRKEDEFQGERGKGSFLLEEKSACRLKKVAEKINRIDQRCGRKEGPLAIAREEVDSSIKGPHPRCRGKEGRSVTTGGKKGLEPSWRLV